MSPTGLQRGKYGDACSEHLHRLGDITAADEIARLLVQAVSLPRISTPAAAVRELFERFVGPCSAANDTLS